MNKEYALYKGDELLIIGTIREIAKIQKVQPESISYLKTAAHKRKIDKCKNSRAARILILIDEGEDDE